MVYTDDRNWDQNELDRARELAKENVVTEGSTVPQAARLNQNTGADAAKPSPVLEGERATTEAEREVVEAEGPGANMTDGHDVAESADQGETATKQFEEDAKEDTESK